MNPLNIKKLHLLFEVEMAIKLLQSGLAEFQKINAENEFYHFPFMLLSSGFERLLKCIKCYYYFETEGRFPTFNEIKTHDLVSLKDEILSKCFEANLESKCEAVKQDYNFIRTDTLLNEILFILSEFGKFSRYYNLDVVTENQKSSLDVKAIWEGLELKIAKENLKIEKMLIDPSKTDELYQEIVKFIVIKLEKFARALTRQFTLSNLGEEAKTCTAYLWPFLGLTNEELGLKDYRNP